MTPTRAKRNSKAPERFSSDESKVDNLDDGQTNRDANKPRSTTKSKPVVREPLKVKLPKLKRPQPLPPQIKVKISRTNGASNANKRHTNIGVMDSPTVRLNNDVINKGGSPKRSTQDVKKEKKNQQSDTNKNSDLNPKSQSLQVKSFDCSSSLEQDSDTNDSMDSKGIDEKSQVDELDSSFSSAASEKSAMQIILEKRSEPNSSGIRCPCGVDDDLGVMVECEKCSTWQHGHCINVCAEEDAYEGYVCGYCSLPVGKHSESLHQLTVNDKFQSKFDRLEMLMRKRSDGFVNNPGSVDENRVNFSSSELEQAVLDLKRVSDSLRVKWRLLINDDYTAELKIWRHPIWSENVEENLKQQQQQTVTFIGDVYKNNLKLNICNMLSKMQKRCQLIRYQISNMEELAQEPKSKFDNLLIILDDISRVVEGFSGEIKQN